MMKSVYNKSVAILWLFVALAFFPGCKDDTDEGAVKQAQEQRYFDLYMGATYKDTIAPPLASGLFYIEINEGTGDSPGKDDWVMVNYVAYVIPDELVVDTYIKNVAETSGLPTNAALFGPFKMHNESNVAGLQEGLTMMREGGGAIMCFTSDLGYGTTGTNLMRNVEAYKSMKYEVELLDVIGGDIEAYEQTRIEAFVDTISGVDTIYDAATKTVMYYVVDEFNEEGSEITNDSVVEIGYKGYLIDGRVFDESSEDAPFKFTVGDYSAEGSPIPGWHFGVTRFRAGEKGRLIIPYPLAYGEDGSVRDSQVAIPPYETLIFDIEVVSVGGTPYGTDPEEPI